MGVHYLADVTSLVTGNGSYSIGGATDKLGAYGEGVQLLAVYSNSSSPLKQINVAAGFTANDVSGPAVGTITFGLGAYGGGPTHYFQNALDGQTFGDTFSINGTDVSGVFPGTFAAGDAFTGLKGPFAGSGNLYDYAEGDSSPYMTIGDTSITGVDTVISDCIGLSFAAISFGAQAAVPEPASVALFGIGLVCVAGYGGLRRRK